jgi:hypothetical protein
MQTPPRPPPGPLVAPPAPRRNRAGPANARFAGPARPRVLVPPLIFGNGGMPPPGGEPARSRSRSRTQKQKQQKRKQKQTRKQK